MKINEKGQALIEFIILMPIFILIFFGIVDFGRIYYTKVELQSKMNDVVEMIDKEKSYSDIKRIINNGSENNINVFMIDDNSERTIDLQTKIKLYTPGLDIILSNPYDVIISRTILLE
ncbi:MAG: TadE family protein [Bacilli bacterium]